ncbi:hypothetical protein ACH4TP_37730 [Streptomyces sp. NPDC021012]|uniref:hypothetical protein n=1 Tax=Streptomyces sp. NPDC021012 TaxID=3365107 RepID=UPI00378E6619
MNEHTFAGPPRRVEITADLWKAEVVVDGTDMTSALRAYALSQEVGQPPTVVLYPSPQHTATFAGFARVQVAEQADPGPVIVDFLRAINPAALDQAALGRDDLDGSPTELTKAMLAQLIDWAEGRT